MFVEMERKKKKVRTTASTFILKGFESSEMKLESQAKQHIRNRNNNFIFKEILLFS
jgi:hypothetical protein